MNIYYYYYFIKKIRGYKNVREGRTGVQFVVYECVPGICTRLFLFLFITAVTNPKLCAGGEGG
jgi:hypothetical protein